MLKTRSSPLSREVPANRCDKLFDWPAVAVVAGWALAQRPELLPGLTVEEAAAGRPVLIATIVGVALGGLILIPSLALLFGLVLHGRFDEQAAKRSSDRATLAPRRPRLSLWRWRHGQRSAGAGFFFSQPVIRPGWHAGR